MDSDMNTFFQKIQAENNKLTELVTDLEGEVFRITQQCGQLEAALAKQKKFHRKYAEDMVTTEDNRTADFKEEKRSLVEQIQSLTKVNRQLDKDLDFYKKAYQELCIEDEEERTASKRQPVKNTSQRRASAENITTSVASMANVQIKLSECQHKSSKVLSKMLEKFMMENKKLKSKVESLNSSVRILKAKSQQFENLKKKINNKKLKFVEDSNELTLLVDSSQRKNKLIFTPEILAKIGELSKYKFE